NNQVITPSKRKFLKQYKLTNVIRLRPKEYAAIPLNATYLTLFNLQHTHHQPGKRYALPVIVTPGYYRKDDEVLPVLSFQNCLVGECIQAKNGLSYQELSAKDFTHSLTTIQNRVQLQLHIFKKYCQSMPDLSEKGIVSLGVALTTVKIISRWEEYLKRL
ncbi:hypothetical protein HYU22_02040, partial [Candidatus Woesearchaeota archaeon]|nr:hypothetical protein [Candidatus Woesearchaeota archaeon]